MKEKSPFFSIIMPVYNMGGFLSKSIGSLLSQSFKDWELVAVDDGSVDETPIILDNYARFDTRIKVIHQKNSGCAGAARNTALKYISGQYMQMLDADDYFSPDLLETLKKRIDETNADIIVPIAKSVDDKNNILYEWLPPNSDYKQIITGSEAFELSLDWSIHGWMCVYVPLLKKIGYESKLMNGDEFTTRKLFHNAKTVAFAKGIYFYFNNLNSTTKRVEPRLQLYQPLNTTYNIYLYALSNADLKDSINILANSFLTSLIVFEIKYFKELKELKKLNRNVEVNNFLRDMYSKKNKEMLKSLTILKHRIIYSISFNSFLLFKFYCCVYATICSKR